MTLALRYAVRSDVGLLREGNEDSAYAGPHLLAVADGMGGHAAGEVASAATITTIASLDGEQLGTDLAGALAEAVATANMRLQELIISDPAIEGMGTTLTALLWSDGYAALCHIGDSRAYLLRNGQFVQITHDHTLVQSLVDEGKISEDDVATHPHRSLLLRALDGRTIAEPDLSTLETLPGDRYLLCSDGLSGVVTEQTLHQTLSSIRDPEKATLQLVDLAIRGGGPDNITCIVADVLDTQISAVPPTRAPVLAGAAANGSPERRSPVRQSSPATRAMRLTRTAPQPTLPDEAAPGGWDRPGAPRDDYDDYTGTLSAAAFPGGRFDDDTRFDRVDGFRGLEGDEDDGTVRRRGHRVRRHGYDDGINGTHRAGREGGEDDDYGQRGRRRWPIVTASLVLLVLVLGGGAYGAWLYNQRQYYVGVEHGYVAIFRGTNQNLAGISLSSLVTRSALPVRQLGPNDQASIAQTISKGSLTDAQLLIDGLQASVSKCHGMWTALVSWQAAEVKYRNALALAPKTKTRKPVKGNPGAMPPWPDAASCAPAAAFNIPSSALPSSQPATAQTGPASTPGPTTTRSAKPSARTTTSSTPRATP